MLDIEQKKGEYVLKKAVVQWCLYLWHVIDGSHFFMLIL